MLGVEEVKILPPNLLVSHYLLASYCYYWQDESPMTDAAYDLMCKRLHAAWDQIDHQHKHLVDREALSAGTCLLPACDYPNVVYNGWESYLRNCLSGRARVDLHTLYAGRLPIPLAPTMAPKPVCRRISTTRVRRRSR
ncbi:hypothetical protein [Pseudomonas phage BHU-1]|nr:hypothetical protein [Pseudomonas phage BHU-1]UGV20002.1 hypothetical protein [Pseudomonas phage Pa BHU-15]UIW13564.1 hypothetical protein [Pseudomonas phage Pa BHU-17]